MRKYQLQVSSNPCGITNRLCRWILKRRPAQRQRMIVRQSHPVKRMCSLRRFSFMFSSLVLSFFYYHLKVPHQLPHPYSSTCFLEASSSRPVVEKKKDHKKKSKKRSHSEESSRTRKRNRTALEHWARNFKSKKSK